MKKRVGAIEGVHISALTEDGNSCYPCITGWLSGNTVRTGGRKDADGRVLS